MNPSPFGLKGRTKNKNRLGSDSQISPFLPREVGVRGEYQAYRVWVDISFPAGHEHIIIIIIITIYYCYYEICVYIYIYIYICMYIYIYIYMYTYL